VLQVWWSQSLCPRLPGSGDEVLRVRKAGKLREGSLSMVHPLMMSGPHLARLHRSQWRPPEHSGESLLQMWSSWAHLSRLHRTRNERPTRARRSRRTSPGPACGYPDDRCITTPTLTTLWACGVPHHSFARFNSSYLRVL
jgi:hypothetical protein